MQKIYRSIIVCLLLVMPAITLAQDKKADADALVRQGTVLHDAQKYDEAIAKYNEALKVDPDNLNALYEKGFTLYASGKADDAIPLLEKVANSNTSPHAFAVLGNIYDDRNDFGRAISCYTKGIAAFPKDGNLWYNLGVSYMRQNKNQQAEDAAIESIKINRKHLNSYRLYALATYSQGKHECSLLAWCNYLMLVPQPKQSAEACNYIKNILHYSINGGNIVIKGTDEQSRVQQMDIAAAVSSIDPLMTSPKPVDSLGTQLASVFRIVNVKKEKFNSAFFSKYFCDFFGAMEKTKYMDVFTHYITVSMAPAENLAWLKARPDEIKGFNEWLASTKRETE
ncbi:MAG: Tetratricopeptide repeat protein [Mucilaginibacter sp.]|nr:Tetratricopeptide repeat protein [Mucilaginibacter sp.]